MGTSISKEQEKLIVEYLGKNGRLGLLFDSDESGERARKEVMDKLIGKVYVKIIKVKGKVDPDNLSKKDIDELI